MKSIIEREETFENNSDMEVKVTQKQLSRAFVKKTQWSKTCSTVKSTWQAKHWGGASPRSKFKCVWYVCPILNLLIIISSRRGKRNMLTTFTLGSIECNLFSVSEFQRSCHCLSAWIRNLCKETLSSRLGLRMKMATRKAIPKRIALIA